MKKIILFLITTSCSVSLFAQNTRESKAYAAELSQIQDAVWGNAPSEFKVTHIPADLDKESAVILAKEYNLSRVPSGKIKFVQDIGIKTRPTKFSIFHERIKINDKVALQDFSTVEYQKKLDRTRRVGFDRYKNIDNMFIGAKVVKPDGKEIIVNTSEEVLTKNEEKDKESKLAISELQVGDILDYFVCKEDIVDKEVGNLYEDNDNVFVLAEEYPVLYFSLDFQYSKRIKVKTIYANGAQHFEESQNDDGDQIFSLKLKNVPKYHSHVWTSEYRQYPYIEIGSAYDDKLDDVIRKNNLEGESQMLQAQKITFEKDFNEFNKSYVMDHIDEELKKYFRNDKKYLSNFPLDSVMKVMYAIWKYDIFCKNVRNYTEMSDLNERMANGKPNVLEVSFILDNMKIDHDIMLVASRNSNSLNDVFNMADFNAFIRINGDKTSYMFFDDIVTHYDEIPERYQGEKVIALHSEKKDATKFPFTESEEVLPVTSSDMNNINERTNITLDDKNTQKLKVERIVTQTGALRHDDQKTLLGIDEMDAGLTAAAKGEDLYARYLGMIGSQKFITLLHQMFDKAKTEQVKRFTDEIKSKFEQEPQQVTNCKIISHGVDNSSPVFTYSAEFELDNLVKKAGSNLIIDVGKLCGSFYSLEEKERKRTVDIYMPCARSFNYTISITIPNGYDAKGMEELTAKKENKTGSFSSTASVKGNVLTILVSRAYAHNFEKAADWPLMTDIIDAASNFNSKKILFEKK